MDKRYSPKTIEPKWQKEWEKLGNPKPENGKKYYILDMFPYPSGDGLHTGHVENYTATDILARYMRMCGYAVMHPIGWDAFGLPAENFAIKTGVHPDEKTHQNIRNFIRQIKSLGISYDWDREIDTSSPEYYKWTQWMFLFLYEHGLAYKKKAHVNWCDSCQTVLANEQAEGGICERCKNSVVQKELEQWFFRITDFVEDAVMEDGKKVSGLLSGLEKIDWPASTKAAQRNWIGRSVGTTVKFQIPNHKNQTNHKSQITNPKPEYIEVFTTRVDTIFGCTYVVVAPEHPLVTKLLLCHSREGGNPDSTNALDPRVKPEDDNSLRIANFGEVEKYVEATKKKSDLERTELAKEKTGVKLEGIEAINPFTGGSVPVYVADYVLGSYGTGAVMAVPAHDIRDAEFASKYGLAVKPVIVPIGTKNQESGIRNQEIAGVGALVELQNGKYLFQQRDENTDRDPGRITPFGGGREGSETTVQCVLRELEEEISVIIGQENITSVGIFESKNRPGQFLEMFIVRGINEKDVHVLEGSGYVVSSIEDALKNSKVTDFTKEVLRGYKKQDKEIFTEDGTVIDSGEFSELSSSEAREKMVAWLEEKGLGKGTVKYRLRDWLISRQRYWGAPIPIIYCDTCGAVPVPESDLPVLLPTDVDFRPTGESPLVRSESFHDVKCPKCGEAARRESDTMDTFVCSSWYYLRFADPNNKTRFADPEKITEYLPVDFYMGGAEHSVLHLLYARFITKALAKYGQVGFDEPFTKLRHQGMVLAEDGRKMSKSLGNVVNPDEIVGDFGADTLRLYEMFMGPLEDMKSWNTGSIIGSQRFLDKVWRLSEKVTDSEEGIVGVNVNLEATLHQTIKKVTEDIEVMGFNTAISALMILSNAMEKESAIPASSFRILLILLSPFAPHIAEELWEKLGNEKSIFLEKWPQYDPEKAVEMQVTIAVSVNGKVRDTLTVTRGISEEELRSQALSSEKVRKYLEGKEPKKVIVVPGRIVNIVI